MEPRWPNEKRVLSIQDEIESVFVHKPHTFILGAGASLAACIDGDKNGRKLPVMDNFVKVLGLEGILKDNGIDYKNENFEVLYGRLVGDPNYLELTSQLENFIQDYFARLELPDYPTIYDYLVLCLRSKDVIATFNWDPFLVQAIQRNQHFAQMPAVFFLHGNVAVGYCPHHFVKGPPTGKCPECRNQFMSSSLLFPIENKNYSKIQQIKNEWDCTTDLIKCSNVLTMFGYGAPKSDAEAVELMKNAWHRNKSRKLLQTEFIDIKTKDTLYEIWRDLWFSGHYTAESSFFSSWVARHPRRSCEMIYAKTIEAKWVDGNQVPQFSNFESMYKWLDPLVEREIKAGLE